MTVYTGGTFDLFHLGHIELLEYCRIFAGQNGKVIVSLNTDEFITEFKGKPPILPYKERERSLLSCKYVDQIIPNIGGKDSKIAISMVKPDIVLIGSDWLHKDYPSQMNFDSDWLNKNKISLIFVPRTTGLSTSLIKSGVEK